MMGSDRRHSPASAGYFSSGIPYVRAGNGPRPLVIFQGLLFENKPQRGMALGYKFLENRYTLYAVLRKAGLPQGFTMKDMADDYATMVQEEFGGQVDVIGVSTGGSIAMHFAADHSDLVHRLVIHSSAHTLSDQAKRLQLDTARLAQERQWARAYDLIFSTILPQDGFKRNALRPLLWLLARLMSLGAPKDPNDLVVTVEAEDNHHFKDRLGEIIAPTLVIAGEQDPFYTPELFRETAAGIPNARLILYEQMGHPAGGKQFGRDVLAFLQEEPTAKSTGI